MISFTLSLIALVVGYMVYGKFVERVFGPDDRPTPAISMADGMDYVALPGWKIFMIQFLNIAGTGPIFGAIMGAWYGPVAYLWIVLGCVFAGAVHDYLSGMLSVRNGGASLPELVGKYLGRHTRKVALVFTVLLLMMVGVVFVYSPAIILHGMWGSEFMWVIVIFIYYIIATMLPIDKIIGKVYPLFAFSLLFMAVALMVGLYAKMPALPELWSDLKTYNPDSTAALLGADSYMSKNPLFPCLFLTIACGAISGFHATQSPLMARCMKNERQGRRIFYGAMITEGVVALVWATISSYFFFYEGWRAVCPPEVVAKFEGQSTLSLIQFFDAPTVVNIVCASWLGTFGSVLALLGIVAAPITTGGSSFRTARLILSEAFGLKQNSMHSRLLLSLPVFAVGIALLAWQIGNPSGFGTVWQYVAWGTQVMAAITLWMCTVYLRQEKKCFWLTLIPAIFMTMVVTDFLFVSPTIMGLDYSLSLMLSSALTLLAILRFSTSSHKK